MAILRDLWPILIELWIQKCSIKPTNRLNKVILTDFHNMASSQIGNQAEKSLIWHWKLSENG
jgi:hypothetical protein